MGYLTFFINRIALEADTSAADSGVSILNTAIVVGFGGVVAKTQGFTDLVAGLKHLSMPPLIFVMVTVAVCAGACGSASGGMGVAFKALKDTYLKLGASLPDIHRISTRSSHFLLLALQKYHHLVKCSTLDSCILDSQLPVSWLCTQQCSVQALQGS